MRRPADQYKPGATPREVVWAELRQRHGRSERIAARDLAKSTGLQPKTVCDYLGCLALSGHLAPIGILSPTRLDQEYELACDTGVEAPRVRRDGSTVEQGGGTEAMWRTMQVLGEFTAEDIAHHATNDRCTVSEAAATSYVSVLARAGYLRIVRPGNGNRAQRAIYRLIQRTGPRPPQVQRVKRVYDPNTGETRGLDALRVEELA